MKKLLIIPFLLAACAYEEETPRGFVGDQPVVLPATCSEGEMINVVEQGQGLFFAEPITTSADAGPQAFVCVDGGWVTLNQEINQ